MSVFILCVNMLAMALCGDFDPKCYDKFTECNLDGDPTIMCAEEIGQTTDVDCRFYLED